MTPEARRAILAWALVCAAGWLAVLWAASRWLS